MSSFFINKKGTHISLIKNNYYITSQIVKAENPQEGLCIPSGQGGFQAPPGTAGQCCQGEGYLEYLDR